MDYQALKRWQALSWPNIYPKHDGYTPTVQGGSSMAEEGYNGWTNWDTWDTYSYMSSDEGVYKEARRIAGCGRTQHLRELAVHLIPSNEGIDFNAVNWEEIEEAFLEE